jgi:phosphoribosylformimino-5-aminoimidazole carboxamide ribotide isomerase
MAVQVAGGIRSADQARAALLAGADRVVLGSALIADPALAVALVAQHGPERIVAALDVRDGRAFGDGWVAAARSADVLDHARALAANGVRWFAVTAIARDGLMSGPDLVLLENVRKAVPDAAIIASGGVSNLDDIRQLASFGYDAAIIGRALYEGAFSLSEALATAERPS